MICVEILRPVPAGDHNLKPGEIHDATGWRNVQKLVELGKVRYRPDLSMASAAGDQPKRRGS